MLAILTEKNHFAPIHRQQACVVKRGELEIQFFDCYKNAGAWLGHTLGVTPSDARKAGWEIHKIEERGPKPGDVVIYDGTGPSKTFQEENNNGGIGVLEHSAGSLIVFFSASAYRDGPHVSISGGPGIWVSPKNLVYNGLYNQRFWRWHAGFAGGSQGGDYWMVVPMWRWDGIPDPFEDESSTEG